MDINEEKFKEAREMLCEYLKQTAREKKITLEEIAEKTGFTLSNVGRMLSGKYPPTLDNFLKLAEAVDAYLFVIDKDANDDLVETMKNRWGKVNKK